MHWHVRGDGRGFVHEHPRRQFGTVSQGVSRGAFGTAFGSAMVVWGTSEGAWSGGVRVGEVTVVAKRVGVVTSFADERRKRGVVTRPGRYDDAANRAMAASTFLLASSTERRHVAAVAAAVVGDRRSRHRDLWTTRPMPRWHPCNAQCSAGPFCRDGTPTSRDEFLLWRVRVPTTPWSSTCPNSSSECEGRVWAVGAARSHSRGTDWLWHGVGWHGVDWHGVGWHGVGWLWNGVDWLWNGVDWYGVDYHGDWH